MNVNLEFTFVLRIVINFDVINGQAFTFKIMFNRLIVTILNDRYLNSLNSSVTGLCLQKWEVIKISTTKMLEGPKDNI